MVCVLHPDDTPFQNKGERCVFLTSISTRHLQAKRRLYRKNDKRKEGKAGLTSRITFYTMSCVWNLGTENPEEFFV